MDLIQYVNDPGTMPSCARLPTRGEVRALVAAHERDVAEATRRGESPEPIMLEQRSRVMGYAAALQAKHGATAASFFVQIWREETAAARHSRRAAPRT